MSTEVTASVSYNPSPIVPIRTAPATPGATILAAAAVQTGVAAPHPSPVSLLDPSTGLVVLEFYNAQGTETESLPTKKQLDSYRLHEPVNNIFQRVIHDDATPLPPIDNGSSTAAGSVTASAASADARDQFRSSGSSATA